MPRTIYKYPFMDSTTIEVTSGEPKPLFAGIDPATGAVAVWCEVDPDGEDTATFSFVGTGWEVPQGSYVGSCIAPGGFVWHVYRT